LVQRIRDQTLGSKNDLNAQLDTMAADPDIRREIQQIEEEFKDRAHGALLSWFVRLKKPS
jgi:hypothetical protein